MDRMSLSDRLLPALFGPTNTTRFPGSSDVPSLNLILVILYRYFSVCVATGMFMRLPSCLPRAACYFPSNTIPPIPWLALPVSHGKDYDLRREILVNDAEGKLPEGVFSEIGDVDWPTLRRFPDSSYRLLKSTFKVNRCDQAALSVPSQRRQILLFRLRMEPKRLTCHAAVNVPSAGPRPKR